MNFIDFYGKLIKEESFKHRDLFMPWYTKKIRKTFTHKGFAVLYHGRAYIFSLFLLLSSCMLQASSNKNTVGDNKPDVWLTIFVHGIISIKPYTTVTNFVRFLTDNVSDSPYGTTVAIMRDDPFFFQNQAIQSLGLQPIDLLQHTIGGAASLMARLYEKNNAINAATLTKNYYYTYGWSGLLSRQARYKDAKLFINALEHEVAKFRAQGFNPKIRLIGYSHGGTLILKLALVKIKEQLTLNFSIDEVFFFGTPIQYDTDYLISDPVFKKVYNIFSRSDRVQRLDFFSSGQFFSDQIVRPHCNFECLPEKLTQLEIRVIRKRSEKYKPLSSADECEPLLFDGTRCAKNIRNVSPGHTELWFFGWTPLNYRKSFPLYPLPIVSFLPFIINSIKPFENCIIPEKPAVITIDPRRNSMILSTNNYGCKQNKLLPFIGVSTLIALQNEALQYKPNCQFFNWNVFNKHIEKAYEKAQAALKEKYYKQQAKNPL